MRVRDVYVCIFSLDIWNYIKNENVNNKFRLVTAMHCNGPLPQVYLRVGGKE